MASRPQVADVETFRPPTFRHYLAYLIVVYLWPTRWLHVLWHPKFSEDFPLLGAAGFYAFWSDPEEDF